MKCFFRWFALTRHSTIPDTGSPLGWLCFTFVLLSPAWVSGQIVVLSSGYDIVALNDVQLRYNTIPGRVYGGGDVLIRNSTIGRKSNNSLPVVYASEDLRVTEWSHIYRGDAVYGSSANVNQTQFQKGFGVHAQSNTHKAPFSTNTVRQHFQNLSRGLANLDPNGSVQFKWGEVKLTGNQSVNVFNLDLSAYQNAWGMSIHAPRGSTVIVNLQGSHVNWLQGNLHGIDASNVLFNFADADALQFSWNVVAGSYLAPWATVSGVGHFDGQLIGWNIDLPNATFTGRDFNGNLPVTAIPEPGTYAAILGGLALMGLALRRVRLRTRQP